MNLLQRSYLLPIRCGIFNQSITFRIPRLTTLSNTRTFIVPKKKLTKMERLEAKLKSKDKMPDSAILVYNNPATKWIVTAFHFQNFFLLFGTSSLIHFIRKYLNGNLEFPLYFYNYYVAKKPIEVVGFVSIVTFVLVLSILACKISVLRVYFDKAKNVNYAVLVGYLPFLTRVITIKPKSIYTIKRRFPVQDFNSFEYQANGKKIFLFENFFRRPVDLHKMTKYD